MRFVPQAAAAALLVSNVLGHPSAPAPSRNGIQQRAIDLSAFRLKTSATYTNSEVTQSTVDIVKRGDYIETATALLQKIVPGAEFRVVGDHYIGTNGVAHVNFKQTVHGLDIDNADFNVNVSTGAALDSLRPGTDFVSSDCQRWIRILIRKLLLHWCRPS
jgi:extracellular elastinolytic metalloproteinase